MTNAKFYRNLICAGLGALALSYVPLSHAGYAQLAPPEGWSAGSGGAATYRYPSASNAASYTNGTVQTNAALRVNGQAVQVPARMRVAANAGRYAAAAIFANPALRTVATVATWLGVAGMVYDVADGLWKKVDSSYQPVTSSKEYFIFNGQYGYFQTPEQAGESYRIFSAENNPANAIKRLWVDAQRVYVDYQYGGVTSIVINSRDNSCPVGWYVTSAGCIQTPPMQTVTQPEFEQMVPDARPMPPELPGVVWPAVWPVKAPEIQPMFIPTGNPVPNPKYDPAKAPSPANQPYSQPGVRVVPAPTADNPWQVDLQPVDRPVDSPLAKPEPAPEVNPDGTPKPDQGDMPKEDKETQDFCEKNPDVLACQKVDTEVENEEIPKTEKTVSYQAENIWGGGACPADKYARVGGQEIKVVDWSRDCQFVTDYVKPVALALSALIVAYILAGALKS